MPAGSEDDQRAAALVGADFARWDDETVDWGRYDRVVLRSTWDYTRRVRDFLAWCSAVGPRLRNSTELVAFNADKRYLGELSAPSVPTSFVGPGEDHPALEGEVVVKPNISAGARDTGRFGPDLHGEARALIDRIRASGRVALVQPYLASVDEGGETALVFLGGTLSHTLRKRPVLRAPGEAPLASGELASAAVMFEDDLVVAASASEAQRSFADRVMAEVSDRFGTPLYARVDLAAGAEGEPLLLELEAIEPALYLGTSPGAAERFAAAVHAS